MKRRTVVARVAASGASLPLPESEIPLTVTLGFVGFGPAFGGQQRRQFAVQ